jgi:hypothetical protein
MKRTVAEQLPPGGTEMKLQSDDTRLKLYRSPVMIETESVPVAWSPVFVKITVTDEDDCPTGMLPKSTGSALGVRCADRSAVVVGAVVVGAVVVGMVVVVGVVVVVGGVVGLVVVVGVVVEVGLVVSGLVVVGTGSLTVVVVAGEVDVPEGRSSRDVATVDPLALRAVTLRSTRVRAIRAETASFVAAGPRATRSQPRPV